MSETRKLAAILASDVVGYSRLAGADEDRTLARLRTLRSDLIDPIISVHHGRVVKHTGDGIVTLPCEVHRRSMSHGLFKPPQRPRATCSSPRPVARDEFELT